MATQLIRLKDGIWVETDINDIAKPMQVEFSKSPTVETTRGGALIAEQIAGGSEAASALHETFDDMVRPLLEKVCQPFESLWKNATEHVQIEQADIELGISVGGEGKVFFLAKASANANLKVKLTLKPKKPAAPNK